MIAFSGRKLPGFVLAKMLVVLLLVPEAKAVSRPPVPAQLFKAVRIEWKTRAERVRAFDIAWCESRFNFRAVSPDGSNLGAFQINRVHAWVDWRRIFDPFYNA